MNEICALLYKGPRDLFDTECEDTRVLIKHCLCFDLELDVTRKGGLFPL